MERSEVTQRIGDVSVCADVDSDRSFDYKTRCAHLDLTVSNGTLATAHSIALIDLTPRTTHYYRAISATRVRSIFSHGQRETDVSAGCG